MVELNPQQPTPNFRLPSSRGVDFCSRDYGATFRHQLDESLKRLQTDHIDLLQFHEIIHEGEPDRILSEGAREEAIRAREKGKIRFIGFTGHRWLHLFQQMLEKDFEWDTVQMPTNLLDYHYRSFTKEILPILVERGIGIIGMKSLGGSGARILESGVTAQMIGSAGCWVGKDMFEKLEGS